MRTVGSDDLARERFRLLLRDLQESIDPGERGGWQQQVAERLGVSQSTVSKIMRGDREPGMKTISEVRKRLRLHRDYFWDEQLNDPDWRDYVDLRGGEPQPDPAPPFWDEFVENYDRIDELDADDLEQLKSMGFKRRRGPRRLRAWTDWVQVAEWLVNRQPSDRFEKSTT